jgi:DNA-binding MarR family transcriptional regulator
MDTSTPDYATLRSFYRQMHRIVDRWDDRLRELGLHRRKFLVLVAIKSDSRTEAPSIGSLTKSTGLNRNVVREVITALVEQGLVTRAKDDGDRRRSALALTPTGEEWLEVLARGGVKDLSGWGADLVRVLQRIVPETSTRAAGGRPIETPQFTPAHM